MRAARRSAAAGVLDARPAGDAGIGIEIEADDDVRVPAQPAGEAHRRQRQGARQAAIALAVDEDGAVFLATLQEAHDLRHELPVPRGNVDVFAATVRGDDRVGLTGGRPARHEELAGGLDAGLAGELGIDRLVQIDRQPVRADAGHDGAALFAKAVVRQQPGTPHQVDGAHFTRDRKSIRIDLPQHAVVDRTQRKPVERTGNMAVTMIRDHDDIGGRAQAEFVEAPQHAAEDGIGRARRLAHRIRAWSEGMFGRIGIAQPQHRQVRPQHRQDVLVQNPGEIDIGGDEGRGIRRRGIGGHAILHARNAAARGRILRLAGLQFRIGGKCIAPQPRQGQFRRGQRLGEAQRHGRAVVEKRTGAMAVLQVRRAALAQDRHAQPGTLGDLEHRRHREQPAALRGVDGLQHRIVFGEHRLLEVDDAVGGITSVHLWQPLPVSVEAMRARVGSRRKA